MKCPVCGAGLRQYSCGGQTLDACPGCRGMWFDPEELGAAVKEMVREGVVSDQDARDAYQAKRASGGPGEPAKPCPNCGAPMTAFNYSYDSNVFLDRCPSCRGVWADAGEIGGVARHVKGNPAVNRYAESLAKELSGRRGKSLAARLLQSRLLSGVVALLYLGAAAASGEAGILWKLAAALALPVSCIWFSEAMGGYTGLNFATRPAITGMTPGVFIALGGWIVLLSPLVLGVILALR